MSQLTSLLRGTITAATVLLLSACGSPITGPATTGLSISITDSISRTLAPPLDLIPATFTVTGSGPNGATFTAVSTGGTVTKSGLAFGTWTVVVNGLNAAGTLVGTGSTTAQVSTGATTPVTVTVLPLSGVGTLAVNLSWPVGQVENPVIAATLTPALGTAQTLPFVVSGSTGSYSNASVGTGYYTLALTLSDTASVVAGSVEVVRIVKGQTTTGTYNYSTVNALGGTIQVGITATPLNPLTVAITGSSPTMSQGATQTLSASVTNYAGNVTYVWYVNGISVGTGANYTFGANQAPGVYSIDVTAFAADGSQGGSLKTNTTITVPSGSSWTARVLPTVAKWSAVAFGSNTYVAVAEGTATAATSSDGIAWTAQTLPAAEQWSAVTYGSGVFVAVAKTGSMAATSVDGVTWTARTLPAGVTPSSIVYGNGKFVAIGNGTTKAVTSTDGITWTARTLPAATSLFSVAYGNGVFVATGSTTTGATSPDGITWTSRTLPSGWWISTTFGGGMFISVSSQSANAATSPDGITWTLRTLPASPWWSSVTYGNGTFVTVASSSGGSPTNVAATSLDGITWTARTMPAVANWNAVAYGNGSFMAVAGNALSLAASSP